MVEIEAENIQLHFVKPSANKRTFGENILPYYFRRCI